MTEPSPAKTAAGKVLAVDDKARTAALRLRDSKAVKVIGTLSDIGDQPQMRLLAGGVLVLGLVRWNPRLVGAGARMLASHQLATVAKNIIKRRVDRTRPRSAATKEDQKPHAGHNTAKEETSFPSGHSAGAMAAACAFAAELPEHRGKALAAAGAVALAQIPRCAHYPSDVGAGLAVGAAADGVVGWIGRKVLAAWLRAHAD